MGMRPDGHATVVFSTNHTIFGPRYLTGRIGRIVWMINADGSLSLGKFRGDL